ncbi:hypothetical protein GCM10010168_32070 [Actinoplanes ianthinogenes]|uniref:Ribosomally synthesized peptide with SipW-like signal peptide n=1 Tax=Actinoplanes ianthinogenes TaxID=122358 RepID=A0ABN6C5G0_9ACTN|nr:helicase [Actinoplanes ianthinogenes]BCJ40348.1 hypothetical protein Aiant_10050 [Actinoplanes ianthinogenes]GGR11619.1 hypothetical protein GCM10010168_32070 [Actinoplanes ianthinogenes]
MSETGAGRRRRRRRRISGLAVPLSILLGSLLVWQSSESAYSATTATPDNTWNAVSVSLTNSQVGSAPFTVATAVPDAALNAITLAGFAPSSARTGGQACVMVDYQTAAPAKIRMRIDDASDTLSGALEMVVDQGTGATNAACAGFVSNGTVVYGAVAGSTAKVSGFPTTWSGSSSGEWTAPGAAQLWYRITWLLPSNAAAATSGTTADFKFQWEAQAY